MTLTLGLLLTADAKGAKAELASTATEAKKLGNETGKAGREARGAATGVETLGTAGSTAAAKVTALANAEAAAGANALKMGANHRIAAGQVGNLTAQFNDIGVMMAAGQNPLQLALQQGTQISQVIGPMGAAGAVKALGSAFIGMINPVSLITIGSIAAGAAMFQWLTGAGEEVVTLDDLLKELEDSVSTFKGAMSAAKAEAGDLIGDYGSFADSAQKVLAIQAEIAQLDSLRALSAAVGDISTTFGTFDTVVSDSGDTLRDNYMDTVNTLADRFDITRFQASELANALDAVGRAEGPDAQVAALAAAREQIELASGGLEHMSEEARAVYDGLLQAELAAARLAGIDVASGIAAAADEAMQLADYLGISLATATQLAMLGPQGVPDANAYRGPNGKVEVGRGGAVDPRKMGGTAEDYRYSEADAFLKNWKPARAGRSGGGGRGTSEVEKQRKALDDLIEREERELALLREADPVRKELLRNREALAGATDQERAKVEELIATRIRETEAMERMEWVSDQAGGALIDALMGGADAGERLIDTLKRAVLEAALLGQGPLAGLFGGGLFGGGLFGGGGGGGNFLADLVGFNPFDAALAEGGMVHGPGSGTSDDIAARLSNGEFVMNAKSTARYRHLLEAMNTGSPVPGFAAGGVVGGSAAPLAAPSGDGTMSVAIDLRGAQGDKAIEDRAYIGMQRALAEYDRQVLPRRMKSLRTDPRRIG